MEKNYKFVIAYDGTRFFGWEHQPDKETIQGKLETVLEHLQGHPVDLIGAGAPMPGSTPGPWWPASAWMCAGPRRRSGTI